MRAALALLILAAASAAPAQAGPFCTCRAFGNDYREGVVMCIRGKLSRCEMNQNVTSWKVIADICPETSLPPETRLAETDSNSSLPPLRTR